MAQITQSSTLHERIKLYFTNQFREWQGIPEMAAEWPEWDEESKLLFELNWGVVEDQLGQLHGWCSEGLLNPSEQARYQELLMLVERNRPLLEELFRT